MERLRIQSNLLTRTIIGSLICAFCISNSSLAQQKAPVQADEDVLSPSPILQAPQEVDSPSPSIMWQRDRGAKGVVEGRITRVVYLKEHATCQRAWVQTGEVYDAEACVESCYGSAGAGYEVTHLSLNFLKMMSNPQDISDATKKEYAYSHDFEGMMGNIKPPKIRFEGTFPKPGHARHGCLHDIKKVIIVPSSSDEEWG